MLVIQPYDKSAVKAIEKAIQQSDLGINPSNDGVVIRLNFPALTEQLGVSRTPVREALSRLRSEGYLDVEAKSGWFVKPLDFGRMDELYDLRLTLELASVARLCTRATEGNPELDALKAQGKGKMAGAAGSDAAAAADQSTGCAAGSPWQALHQPQHHMRLALQECVHPTTPPPGAAPKAPRQAWQSPAWSPEG